MKKVSAKKEILGSMAKFRSRLDILWRIKTQIYEGSIPANQAIGVYQHHDIPLIPLIGIDPKKVDDIKRPTYEDAVKVAFEFVMADFYRIEEMIVESLDPV